MDNLIRNAVAVGLAGVSVIVVFHIGCHQMFKIIALGGKDAEYLNGVKKLVYSVFYAIFLVVLCCVLVLLLWTYAPWVDTREDVEIKVEVPDEFKVPSEPEIVETNAMKTYVEQKRKEEKQKAEDENKRLVEEALKD